ncbi:unnamed protein product [Vicia faba]|uniref:Transposase-associated domain-containing protein n=1 Tax=Vicia faba TaxID=3906 RepID=A0AAV1A3Y4_VICFA|nr:unnamed protein product [Vicia faba]
MIKKDWVELPPHSQSYKDGVNYFLDIAFTKGMVKEEEILCPCSVCCNDSWEVRDVVYDHLCSKGFVKGYTEWIYHGEDESLIDLDGDSDDETSSHDDIDGLLFETFKDVAEGGGVHEGINEDAKKFYKLVNDANQELYPGCEKFSSLSFTIRIYLLKCLHGWSNASFTALVELLKEAMPDLNIPVSFNKTKSMIKDLGLDYKKIDACPNNCMLFWKDHEKDDSCHICGTSRWIEYPEVANDLKESIKAHKLMPKHGKTLMPNNRERVQQIIEVVDETPKKGTQQERVQKVDHNLDKETIAKKMEIDKLSQPKVMKDHAHGDKEVVQETPKKRTQVKATVNRERIQKVDGKLDNHIAMKKAERPKLLQPQAKEVLAHGNKEVSQGMLKKRIHENLLENNRDKIQKIFTSQRKWMQPSQTMVKNRAAALTVALIKINQKKELDKKVFKIGQKSTKKMQSQIEKKKNKHPKEKLVGKLCAKRFMQELWKSENSTFCPLRYTNWSGMPDDNKNRFWRYTNRNFILPVEARDWIETTVREAWRRYKHKIKKNHFLKYSNMTERLKNRPPNVPIAQFKSLCAYWSKETIQAISENNTRNRAQLKWMHRMGPKNFALTREKVREKEKREPTQSETFVETRKGNKGKELDVETGKVIVCNIVYIIRLLNIIGQHCL